MKVITVGRTTRAWFEENSSLLISIAKAELQFLNDLFYQQISIYPAKFPNNLICHCTNSLSSFHKVHISIHHCIFYASLHVKTNPDLRPLTKLRHSLDSYIPRSKPVPCI